MLSLLNKIFRSLQSWHQGIPSIGAKLYKALAMKLVRCIHRYIAEELAKELRREAVVLDVGCGTGDLLIQLSNYIEHPKLLLCLDISKAMVGIARREFILSDRMTIVDVVLGDAHRLPFRTRSIDIVTSVGTLHHLKDPKEFFKECVSVSRNMCMIYEFSHDVSLKDIDEFRRIVGFKAPRPFIKIVAALHGIPRREFVKGALRSILEDLGVNYSIEMIGPLTAVIIRRMC